MWGVGCGVQGLVIQESMSLKYEHASVRVQAADASGSGRRNLEPKTLTLNTKS